MIGIWSRGLLLETISGTHGLGLAGLNELCSGMATGMLSGLCILGDQLALVEELRAVQVAIQLSAVWLVMQHRHRGAAGLLK